MSVPLGTTIPGDDWEGFGSVYVEADTRKGNNVLAAHDALAALGDQLTRGPQQRLVRASSVGKLLKPEQSVRIPSPTPNYRDR